METKSTNTAVAHDIVKQQFHVASKVVFSHLVSSLVTANLYRRPSRRILWSLVCYSRANGTGLKDINENVTTLKNVEGRAMQSEIKAEIFQHVLCAYSWSAIFPNGA